MIENMDPILTVFTPAYNRAHTLGRTYESLKKQDCKEFVWLIIDDGSADDTAELVRLWQQEENDFEIRYIYKENGGMHTAHNIAYENIDTELNVCIDSDDCMAEGAVRKIVDFWKENGSELYAGIIGLDDTLDGVLIGKKFPSQKSITLSGYYAGGGSGDKKLVYRTSVMKKYPPYPVFRGEKYISLGYKYLLCDQDYELLVLNEVLCDVEYQLDGSSFNMYKQYVDNPKGFAFMRKVDMLYDKTLQRKFITCVHYVSSSIFSKNKNFVKESPQKILTILAIPFGILLSLHIKVNTNKYMKISKTK
ncbi:glycosyltransferase family 2 protein [Murimonas intestini]|uniref:Glycosyltransferase involved in cell wall biosynthesis n=1 Tax=Murimonas intestini TaxID=1337051 RepID=A0AB73T6G8_9FIRM|nr:glycosyltransferase family 2 protein [Murimonas intestini]MCR1839601.1 glycosyltransferase family 2 protein [Murimonas intestini]MCR1866444.1 glycosyltransferase family 2 protein [Murimonas intestini]MCR1882438.1 glycosyltransferase family 2 protein [Murimonas intestini]